MFWLSYGGGVNSTALAILLCGGKLPQYEPWRILFADTGNEKDETYAYIEEHFKPYLAKYGWELEVCKPPETVLERWERLSVTGSRMLRSCTVQGKIYPIAAHLAKHGDGLQLIGIDAGEEHRAKADPRKAYPLVDLGIDRTGCGEIIVAAGLPIPEKSGCWCCPYARVGEVLTLLRNHPCRADRIAALEEAATAKHGGHRTQFRDRTIAEWRERASQADLFIEDDFGSDMPCDCYDG